MRWFLDKRYSRLENAICVFSCFCYRQRRTLHEAFYHRNSVSVKYTCLEYQLKRFLCGARPCKYIQMYIMLVAEGIGYK